MTWALSLDTFADTKDNTTRFTLHRGIKKFLEDIDSENTKTTAEKKVGYISAGCLILKISCSEPNICS